jgi:hypothetical protein
METRTRIIGVRLNPEEVALIDQVCKGSGIKPATYCRMAIMKDLQATFPADPMAQLKAREEQQKMAEALASMMLKAFKEAEKGKKRK